MKKKIYFEYVINFVWPSIEYHPVQLFKNVFIIYYNTTLYYKRIPNKINALLDNCFLF